MGNRQFGYGRVSSIGQNTDRQLDALVEYGIDEKNIIIDKQSGKDFNRQGYLKLKEKILKPGDVLVVKELDRLGRNKQMIKEELEYFRKKGIRVKILNVPTTLIDIEGQDWIMEMISNILIEVLATIAEEERLKNHQRQAEGIAAAKKRGAKFGRPAIELPSNFEEIMRRLDSGELRSPEAMKLLGFKKSTFYKFKNSVREI